MGRGTTSAFNGGSRKRCANGSPPTALRRTSCEAVSSNRCTAGSPPPQLQLSGPEQAFLDASVAERDREADELLEREQRAVVAERRQRQRGRQLVIVGLVAVLVAALGVFGTVQWRSAVDAKRDVDDLLDGQSSRHGFEGATR